MSNQPLDEREFELVNIIGKKLGSNQRDLSLHMKMSLGQTNMLIRRLVAKGYIRITQLNKKKVKYLLTPKGFAEKMQKSVKYTLNTINSIGLIKQKISEVVVPLYESGERSFHVIGESDFAHLTEIVFRDLGFQDYKISYVEEIPQEKVEGVLLICREGIDADAIEATHKVDLIHELAKDGEFINNHNH